METTTGTLESISDEMQVALTERLNVVIPTEVRDASTSEERDFAFFSATYKPVIEAPAGSTMSSEQLRDLYLTGQVEQIKKLAWWEQANTYLQTKYGISEYDAQAATEPRQGYRVDIESPDGANEYYEILECGRTEASKLTGEELMAVTDALQIIDQFSGGALTSDKGSSRILVLGDADLNYAGTSDTDRNVMGVAHDQFVALNLPEIRRAAAQSNVTVGEVIGVVLVHEILGHKLERLSSKGVGGNFTEYFDYSEAKRDGESITDIHASVSPKDQSVGESKPVREYGYTNPSEDFATSVDATIAHTVGWLKNAKSDRLGGTPDRYRSELIMQVFDEVARSVREKTGGGVGHVGSPIKYVETPDGLHVEPGRELKLNEMSLDMVIREEVDRLVKPFEKMDQLIVRHTQPPTII